MSRPATGTIMERPNAAGGINRTLRFHVNGERRTVPLGPVSRDEAERRLAQTMADVERGLWEPAQAAKPSPRADVPTFHVFAEEWWVLNEGQLAENTKLDYRWRLEKHLLGKRDSFKDYPINEITYDTVEHYIAKKLASGLSPRSTNMTVILLGAILDTAVERELIDRNPARDRRRRARERKPQRSYLDTSGQIEALLDAAGDLDRNAARDRRHIHRRAMLATLTFCRPPHGRAPGAPLA